MSSSCALDSTAVLRPLEEPASGLTPHSLHAPQGLAHGEAAEALRMKPKKCLTSTTLYYSGLSAGVRSPSPSSATNSTSAAVHGL
jgi:hypothetical protein